MNGHGTQPSVLRLALMRYIDARQASIIQARRDLGVNELDARAILYISANPGTRPTALREYLGITSAGVTTLVDRLVQHRAVRRDVDDQDRRVNRLTLTVDLGTAPWSALTRFDTQFDAALAAADCAESARFAEALDNLTTSASAPLA
ncbi:MarR family transcriptional regulator [Microbacterium sp. NPDC091313]